MSMDRGQFFRNFVSKPDIEHILDNFSFHTVFYRSADSYCCCPCAFEHEYFEYVSDDGEINTQMFEKVAENIAKGSCPHLDETSRKYIRNTGVYGIHIAAVFCKREGFWENMKRASDLTSGIFRLDLYAIAALKNNCEALKMLRTVELLSAHSPFSRQYLHAKWSDQSNSRITFQRLTLLEICVRMRKLPELNVILNANCSPDDMVSALIFAFTHDLVDVQKVLIEHIRWLATTGKFVRALLCADTAIVCNKSIALEKILKYLSAYRSHFYKWLGETISVLPRKDCRKILMLYDKSNMLETPIFQRVFKLVYLLEHFYDICKDEVVNAFKCDLDCLDVLTQHRSEKGSQIHIYLNPEKRRIDVRVLKSLFDLGLDIDSVDGFGHTPLIHWLKQCRGFFVTLRMFHETLQQLVNENPSYNLNENAVRFGLEIDSKRNQIFSVKENEAFTVFQMDGQNHSFIDDDCSSMKFVTPFLLECGFSFKRDDLLDALDRKLLPQKELSYFQHLLDTPRRLKLRCRDVLRKHFRGRNLHKYVESVNIPKQIKDFIQIKPSLQPGEPNLLNIIN